MNISDLSIDALTQLEARMTADLEMVKRVKALVVEYQKMGGQSLFAQSAPPPAAGASVPAAAPATPAGPARPALKSHEERLAEALASIPQAGFILEDLSRATYSPQGCIGKDSIKTWVKRQVRQGKIKVVETRTGRIGSLYAVVTSEPAGTES